MTLSHTNKDGVHWQCGYDIQFNASVLKCQTKFSDHAGKQSVMSQMMRMVEVERYAKANMSNGYKYSNEYWEVLCRTFEIMNLEVLAHTFSADGV